MNRDYKGLRPSLMNRDYKCLEAIPYEPGLQISEVILMNWYYKLLRPSFMNWNWKIIVNY